MKTIFVKDIKNGETISSETFAIQNVKMAEDKNGKPYADVVLVDKTGSIKGKIWSDALVGVDKNSLQSGKIISVTARIDEYRGNLQMNIQQVMEVDESKLEDFLESSVFDADEMWDELMGLVDSMNDESIKKLIHNMLEDERIARGLKYHPAGVYIHHGFRSGLIQHILEIIAVTKSISKYYPHINYDLVIAGAIIHDIGKVWELEIVGPAVNFGFEGMMLGHIIMSYEQVLKFAPEDMDEMTLLKLKNMILSHHGKREYGSPVVPMTHEAILLHKADDLVYFMGAYNRHVSANDQSDRILSDYDNILGHRVYVGD